MYLHHPKEETKTKKKKTIAPAPFTTTRFIFPATFTAPEILEVEIPRNSRAIGIMVQGLSTNYKLIDHGFFLVDANNNPTYITGPDGIAHGADQCPDQVFHGALPGLSRGTGGGTPGARRSSTGSRTPAWPGSRNRWE